METDGVGRVLPDGSADLVSSDDGELFVAGPDTGPVRRDLRAGSLIVGLRLRPGAAGAALGLPAGELRDQQVPLDAVWGRHAHELAERLPAATNRRDLLETELLRRLPAIEMPSPLVAEAIRRLGRPGTRMHSLGATLHLSDRQLRRLFHRAVGYGPKTLDRVLRFQRFLSLGRPADGLARLAVELGYADQAHLTRETRRLSGLSPSALFD